jgi:hypothetical protein
MATNGSKRVWRFPAALAAALIMLCASASAAEKISSKEAIRVMVAAGYSGIGGVTPSDKFYYAAALDKTRHRVRVTVDGLTGKAPRPRQSYYQPPPPHRRIGVKSFPYNSYGRPARSWCQSQASAPGC